MRKSSWVILTLLVLTATLALAQTQVVRGQLVTITVRLTDEKGAPIAGVTVHFLDETDGVEIGVDVTDSSGYATVAWDTSTASPGAHSILIWTEEADYVESAQTGVGVVILAPAELRLSVSAPAAVKPRQGFRIKVTVTNAGEAAALDVAVSLNGSTKSVGDLPAGVSSTLEFSAVAPARPGEYSLSLLASGTEWGTQRPLSTSLEVNYSVEFGGIALEIRAPPSVREGESFNFSLALSNLGGRPISLSIQINLSGAQPERIEDALTLDPMSSVTRAYAATAGRADRVRVTALAQGGGLRARDEVVIEVTSAGSPHRPPANGANATASSRPPTSPPPLRRSSSASSKSEAALEVNVAAETRGKEAAPLLTGEIPAAGSALALVVLVVLRGIWRVEDP